LADEVLGVTISLRALLWSFCSSLEGRSFRHLGLRFFRALIACVAFGDFVFLRLALGVFGEFSRGRNRFLAPEDVRFLVWKRVASARGALQVTGGRLLPHGGGLGLSSTPAILLKGVWRGARALH
jgi:hypothetical protein